MHVPPLLVDLRTLAVQRFGWLAGQLLDQGDDALFNLASRSVSGTDQQDYLDAMRRLRMQRSAIEKGFSQRVVDPLALAPVSSKPSGDGEAAMPRIAGQLSLVAVDELEEQLAGERLAIAVARRHADALIRFGMALAEVWQQPPIDDDEEANPLSPLRIARALGESLHLAELPVAARLVIFKLFERLLLAEYGNLVGELNAFLHSRGIRAAALPAAQLRRPQAIGRAPAPPRRSAASATAGGAEADAAGEADSAAAAGETGGGAGGGEGASDTWFRAMAEIFANYFGQGMAGAAGGEPGASGGYPAAAGSPGQPAGLPGGLAQGFPAGMPRPGALPPGATGYPPPPTPAADSGTVERGALLAALARLQHTTSRGLQRAAGNRQAELGELLKTELLVEVQRDGGPAGLRLSGSDDQALTLVGMLFDVLLDQGRFSDEVRRQMVRALPAYARVALLDQQLFAHRTHPARRLLNALAEACDGNKGETAAERELLLRATAAVDRLVKEYDGDTQLFVQLDEHFERAVQQQRKRASLAERRTAESQRGRERLEEARMTASLEIAALTGGRHPPLPVDEFLRRDWGHHLTMVLLREGEESDTYRSARQIGVDLWKAMLGAERGEDPPAALADALAVVARSTGRDHGSEILAALQSLKPNAAPAPRAADTRPAAAAVKPPVQEAAVAARAPAPPAAVTRSESPAITRPAPAANESAVVQAAPASLATAQVPPAPPAVAAAAAPPSAGFEIVSGQGGGGPELPTGDLRLAIDPTQVSPADIARVRALALGSWVDLVDAEGMSQPAKLSWVSPISQRMLFVNRSGARLCLLSPSECAALITQGKMQPRSEDAAFDRAMVGLLGRLRSGRGERGDEG